MSCKLAVLVDLVLVIALQCLQREPKIVELNRHDEMATDEKKRRHKAERSRNETVNVPYIHSIDNALSCIIHAPFMCGMDSGGYAIRKIESSRGKKNRIESKYGYRESHAEWATDESNKIRKSKREHSRNAHISLEWCGAAVAAVFGGNTKTEIEKKRNENQ